MNEVTKEKILEIVNTNIENGAVTVEQYDSDLSKLGMDSIPFIRIIVSLEEAFECEVPDSKLLLTEMNTISKITDVISAVLENKQKDNVIGE